MKSNAPDRVFEYFNCFLCGQECLWVAVESRPDNLCLGHRDMWRYL